MIKKNTGSVEQRSFSEKFGIVMELFRFGLAGAANTLLAYGIFSLFVFLGVPYYIALFFDYLSAVLFSLFVNLRFTFKLKKTITFRMVYRMIVSYGLLFILNEGILYLFISKLSMNIYFSQAIASVFIAFVSYCLQKIFVFEMAGDKAKAGKQDGPVQ
ncbi:MAG: GtrA family protein [Treponema sp.]|jgi:putative flippase GtrA|nr:GtrA family protein [Treponema sp.]